MAARLTAGEKILRSITEASWQSTVIQIARLNGWVHYHPPANRPGKNGSVQQIVAGWPDLVLIRGKDVLFAELKTELGKTTTAQDWWLAALADAGLETYVWRPSDERKVRERLTRKR